MKVFENWGRKKLVYYFKRHKKDNFQYTSINELFDNKKIYYLSFVVFMIGMVMTIPIIYVELEYHIFDIDQFNVRLVFGYLLIFILFVFLEFYLLFLLGFYLLSYQIHHIQYLYRQYSNTGIKEKEFLAMLVRTVMELPEPEIVKYNINHKEDSDSEFILWAFIYKLKVVMTNIALKFIAKKAFTRSSLRLYTPYIAAVGTGVWDAIVFYKTIKHSQYKIMVRLVILYLWENKKELLLQEQYIKVILQRYFYYGEYNSNFDYLLGKIYAIQNFDYLPDEYMLDKNIDSVNKSFILLLYALKEKKHTNKEKLIIGQIDNDNHIFKELQKALKSGDCDYLYAYIDTNIKGTHIICQTPTTP